MGMLDIFRGKTEESAKATEKAVTEFENPFRSSKVGCIHMHIYNRAVFHNNSRYQGEITFGATITFMSGSTKGEQEIKAGNFVDLVEKVNAFVKAMV